MQSFYFGNSEQPLYAVSHSPFGSNYRDSAILICSPIGHENIRAHRALRVLADKLSETGYHVLRFDYRGVGDSSMNLENMNLSNWIDDVENAVTELKAISNKQKVTVIGLRFGALLSLLASQRVNFEQIILWDPIVCGKSFVDNLKKLHRQLITSLSWFKYERDIADTPDNEYTAYRYSGELIRELEKLDLSEIKIPDYLPITTITTTDKSSQIDYYKNNLQPKIETSNFFFIDDIGNWEEFDYIDSSLTATQVTNRILKVLD